MIALLGLFVAGVKSLVSKNLNLAPSKCNSQIRVHYFGQKQTVLLVIFLGITTT
jgi:hypothetical protein